MQYGHLQGLDPSIRHVRINDLEQRFSNDERQLRLEIMWPMTNGDCSAELSDCLVFLGPKLCARIEQVVLLGNAGNCCQADVYLSSFWRATQKDLQNVPDIPEDCMVFVGNEWRDRSIFYHVSDELLAARYQFVADVSKFVALGWSAYNDAMTEFFLDMAAALNKPLPDLAEGWMENLQNADSEGTLS